MFVESDAYERFMGRWSRQVAPLLVKFASVAAGESVLDVGSGTGALAAALVESVPEVSVTGLDRSYAYVHHAQAYIPGGRLRFVNGDAQVLPFRDGSFDRALSLFALNFVPDPDKALQEMVRTTRAGRTIAAAVWDYAEGMEMLRVFWDEAVALNPQLDVRDERHMPLCRRGDLAGLWRAHGLLDVDEQPLTVTLSFGSFDDYWLPFLGGQGPAGAYAGSLSETARKPLVSRLRDRLVGAGLDGPFTLRARAWAAKGVVPSAGTTAP